MPVRGPLAVGVPGMVDAYLALLTRFGSRRFPELAELGISDAEHGFPLTRDGAGRDSGTAAAPIEFRGLRVGFSPGRFGSESRRTA